MRYILSLAVLIAFAIPPISAIEIQYELSEPPSFEYCYGLQDTYAAPADFVVSLPLIATNETCIQLKSLSVKRMYRSKIRNWLLTNACLHSILNPPLLC